MNEIIDEMIQELDLRGYRVARTDVKKFVGSLKYQLKYETYIYKIPIKKLVNIFLKNKNKKPGGSIYNEKGN